MSYLYSTYLMCHLKFSIIVLASSNDLRYIKFSYNWITCQNFFFIEPHSHKKSCLYLNPRQHFMSFLKEMSKCLVSYFISQDLRSLYYFFPKLPFVDLTSWNDLNYEFSQARTENESRFPFCSEQT